MRKHVLVPLFLLIFLVTTQAVIAQKIFWVEQNNSRIRSADLSPTAITNVVSVATGLNIPRDLSLDANKIYLFYTDNGGEGLIRANYNGTSPIEIRNYGAFTGYTDISYSENAAGVFGAQYPDEGGATFQPEDGSPDFALTFGGQGNDDFISVAADDGNEFVYYISGTDDRIYYTDFSGSSATLVVATVPNLQVVAVDESTSLVYFVAYNSGNEIWRCNSDGSGLTQLAAVGTGTITSLQVYSKFNKIYYVKDEVIYHINLDGTGNVSLLSLVGTGLTDIGIEADFIAPVFSALTPADNATGIAPNSNIGLTFNENVKVSSTTGTANETSIRIFRTTGNVLEQTIPRASATIGIVNNVVTISGITTPLNSTEYYVLVGNKVFSDLSGNDFIGISSTTAWSFTTAPGVTISAPSATTCVGSFVTLPDIVITEAASTNFSTGTNVTLILGLNGTGYSFQPVTGIVSFTPARDISSANINVTATTVTVTYTVTGTTLMDVMTISGLKFTTDNATNPGIDVIRSGGTSVIGGLVTGTVVGSVYSQAAPAAPAVSYPSGSNFCQGSNMAIPIVNVVGTGTKWYNDVGLTSEIVALAGQTSATGTALGISSAAPATISKYVTLTSGSCASTASVITITIDPPPTTSDAGPPQQVCGTSTTLAGNPPTSGTGLWSIISGTGGTIATPASPTSNFTGTAGNSYVLRWTISNSNCTPSTDDVTIQFDVNPTTAVAGSNQALCATSVTLAGNTPVVGTGLWSIISGSGGTIAIPANPLSNFTGTAGTTYVLRWTISNGSCPPSTSDVTVQFEAAPTPSSAGPNQTLCATSTTLAANAPTIGVGLWSIVSGSGGTIASPANPTSNFTGTAGTTYVLRWTTSNGSCASSSSEVTIQFVAPPTTSVAGPNQLLCGTSASLAANTPTIGTGSWSIISGSGGAITTPTSPTSNFTGTDGSTYVLRWTISNTPCAPSTSDVTIQFFAPPTTSVAGSNQSVCGTSVTLAGNPPSVGSGLWTVISGAGGSFAASSSPTSGFTGVAGSTYVLRWTISNGPCTPSSSDVTIQLVANPTVAAAGSDQIICTSSATLAGNTPTIGTGTWSVFSGAGGTIATPSSPSSSFSGTAGTTYVLRWTISNTGCASSSDDVNIQFTVPPTIASAGADQSVCGTSLNLAGNTPASGAGLWSIVSGAGGTIAAPANPTSSFSGVSGTTYILRWTISRSGCSPSSDDVSILFNSFPLGTGTVSGITSLCPGVTGLYTASGIANATKFQWQLPSGFELVSQSGNTANIKAVSGSGGTITVIGENDCGTGGSAKVDVTILPLPDVSIVLPADAFIDEPVVFSFTSSSSIQSHTWSFGDNGTSADASPEHTYTSSGDFTIDLEVVDDKGCKNTDSKTLVVHPDAELSSYSIKNVVTANGDEKNKYLYIERIERFPESEVIVLDRLGVEVFRKKGYTNDWDLRRGEDFLPAGNYVCVVKLNGKVYSRSVTVLKGR